LDKLNPKTVFIQDDSHPDGGYVCNEEDAPKKDKLSKDDLKFNELVEKIDDLLADDIKFVAKHLAIDYSNKEETVAKIKETLGL